MCRSVCFCVYVCLCADVSVWTPAAAVQPVCVCTSEDRQISVRAPDSSSSCTACVSAALMARKRTGMGTIEALGSAPRASSSLMVDQRCLCLSTATTKSNTTFKRQQRESNKVMSTKAKPLL